MSETLPDDHTRTLALALTVAEFRELMRSVGYRSAELADDDPMVAALANIQEKVGHAWEAAGPSGALTEYTQRKATRDSVEPLEAPVEFTEERPEVWKTATPADGERLDSLIDDALGKFGTSLEELRATAGEQERDETPTVCTTVGCGRTRPRWTMTVIGGHPVCSPTFAMHCADCCEPGEMLTHYTMEEHQHSPQRP